MTKQDRITSLKKYIETIERQKSSPPARQVASLQAYVDWCNREIKKTQSTIEQLQAL